MQTFSELHSRYEYRLDCVRLMVLKRYHILYEQAHNLTHGRVRDQSPLVFTVFSSISEVLKRTIMVDTKYDLLLG